MLVRVYRRLSGGGRPIIVSAREALPAEVAALIDAPLVLDACGDAGPLGALVSAASAVRTPLLFAAAGDAPNLEAPFVDALERAYDQARVAGPTPVAILPTWPDGAVEPLAALYDTAAFLEGARTALDGGERKVTAAIDAARTRPYPLRHEDAEMLRNVNTPLDLEAAGRG